MVGDRMRRFVEGMDRGQSTLFPERLKDWIGEDNPVPVIAAEQRLAARLGNAEPAFVGKLYSGARSRGS